ncbi:hypothetical protein Poly30_03690 [Planctomycetes bacterium Poly30]|uniref:Uncharacterized protein n=2 Tax=Saltatorellus ferox TaxID=2528018 RepID=A0A518ELA1_9BACT|nr:hypothetical protein Poly30_03690 [Planctomycetes bacterium Poly30]
MLFPASGGRVPLAIDTEPGRLEVVGEATHRFGDVFAGDEATHTFTLRTVGATPVTIVQAQPSVSTSRGAIEWQRPDSQRWAPYAFGEPIEPGSLVRLTARLSNFVAPPSRRGRILVVAESPVDPTRMEDPPTVRTQRFDLVMLATVSLFVRATPSSVVALDPLPHGSGHTEIVAIESTTGQPFGLAEPLDHRIPMPPGLSVRCTPITPDERGWSSRWMLELAVGADTPPGPHGYVWRRKVISAPPSEPGATESGVTRAKEHFTAVGLTYRVEGALELDETFASFGLMRPGSKTERTRHLLMRDDSLDADDLRVEVVPETGGDANSITPAVTLAAISGADEQGRQRIEIRLQLDVPEALPDQVLRGEVRIHTGDAEFPVLTLRYAGVVRGSARR